MLKNKKILLAVSGGIAAYKAVDVASKLKQNGAEVNVILTQNAEKFITPLPFHSITGEIPSKTMFDEHDYIQHISLSEWADIIVVAPATANIIGKVANGIADDLLTSTIIAKNCPILFIPAMNSRMLNNPIVQENIDKLEHYGYRFLASESGLMACGTIGAGRFPKTAEVLYSIDSVLHHEKDLEGVKLLVTAGGTIEKIDPMRCLSNVSSGKMGIEIARAAALRGAKVTLIYANIQHTLPYFTENIKVENAKSMFDEVQKHKENKNVIIMAAAVADYTPHQKETHKIKKATSLTLEFQRTKDILKALGEDKKGVVLIGFAAESQNIISNAKAKLHKKNLDFIVANNLQVAGKNDTEAFLISDKVITPLSGTKFEAANIILDVLV